jgi:hypothetical protein
LLLAKASLRYRTARRLLIQRNKTGIQIQGERCSGPPAGVAQDKIDEGPKAALKGRWAFYRSRAQLFSEPLLSTRRRMRRRGRSRLDEYPHCGTQLRSAARH